MNRPFADKAEVYRRSRPGYPAALLDGLERDAGLHMDSRIADIGSGTGILAGQWVRRGYAVTAVEPDPDMRAAAMAHLGEQAAVVAGTAENTGLDDGSVDLVTVSQAFHWFDPERFRVECRRILCRTGYVAIIWNSRDPSFPVIRSYIDLCRRLCPEYPGFERGVLGSEEQYPSFFRNGLYSQSSYANDLIQDRNRFLERSLSSSFAPRPEDAHYAAFTKAVSELFDRYQQDGQLRIPNRTLCILGQV